MRYIVYSSDNGELVFEQSYSFDLGRETALQFAKATARKTRGKIMDVTRYVMEIYYGPNNEFWTERTPRGKFIN